MKHEDARRAISERMDGERLSARASAALDRHLSECAACRAYESGSWRLRELARFGLAEAVPDLVRPIVAAAERERSRRPPRLRLVRGAPRPRWPRRIAPVAAAAVVGLLAGSLSVGGPWPRSTRAPLARAAVVSAKIAAAAPTILAYQATFSITEADPSGPTPNRSLSMRVSFRAPERFRLDVRDLTALPRDEPPDDLRLVVNGDASYQVEPSACPVGLCPPRTMVVRNRLPFSSSTPYATDLILPVASLVDARDMRVVARGTVLGRPALEVALPFEQARPLFPFLDLGGTWRPFFPHDRVDLWLDARNWFPLRYTVYPSSAPSRAAWELRFGLPVEPPARPIFDVQAEKIDETPPPVSTFRVPHTRETTSAGARAVPLPDLQTAVHFDPVAPADVGGLGLYRVVVPDGRGGEALLTYSTGLSWVKLGETRTWTGDGFFGPIDEHAEQVDVPGLGTAYYEPASDRHGRRLAIHTSGGRDLYMESNLSREALVEAAAALDVRADPVPDAWLTSSSPVASTRRVTLEQAARAMPFPVLVPASLPDGYSLTSAEIVSVEHHLALNVYFQRDDAALGTGPLRLHEESADAMPPASAPQQFDVPSDGVRYRWTPARHELEWIADGVYFSLDATSLGLADLLSVAASMTPADMPSETPVAATPSAAGATGTPRANGSPSPAASTTPAASASAARP